jgi:hypothetical protein
MNEILPNAIGLWALQFLCENDRLRIREFFACDWDIDRRFILREMHISVYHAQQEMPGVASIVEPVRITLPAAETRFMTFAPGGFEPTPEIIPGEKKWELECTERVQPYLRYWRICSMQRLHELRTRSCL